MLFTKDKIEYLENSEIFEIIPNYNKKELYSFFKILNKKMEFIKSFIENLESRKFKSVGSKLVSTDNSSFEIGKNGHGKMNRISYPNEQILRIIGMDKIVDIYEKNSSSNSYKNSSESHLNLSGILIYFYDEKISIEFNGSIKNKIKKIFEIEKNNFSVERFSIEKNQKYNKFNNIFICLLKGHIIEVLNDKNDKIKNICSHMYELQKVKNLIVKEMKPEEKKIVDNIFSAYKFTYKDKNKEKIIDEIQDIILLNLDFEKKIFSINDFKIKDKQNVI